MEGSRSAPESSVCIASSATAQRPTRRWVPQENSLMRSCKVATSQVPGTAGSAECVCKNSSAQSCFDRPHLGAVIKTEGQQAPASYPSNPQPPSVHMTPTDEVKPDLSASRERLLERELGTMFLGLSKSGL
ncbi:uncharacterized protein [Molothrus aeneus]|uniref:uncharacterized protein isoform X3 n=1 Tax=Molothrus aeneus TaxID=84833 RepID=UPI0034595FC5